MKARIAGLFLLAILALGSLYLSSFWSTHNVSPLEKVQREQADYRAWYWLLTCAVFGGAWIWLLVKTINYRSEDSQ